MKSLFFSELRQARDKHPRLNLADRAIFIANLGFVHNVIVATEDLLREALERSRGDYRKYLRLHLEEERDHAAWLARDLASAGVIPGMPAQEICAMVGSQYYLIRHVDPIGLLGYMAALECFPMCLDSVAELERLHGSDLCRTLRYHAEHDTDHGLDVLEQIERLNAPQFSLVLQNALQTTSYIGAAISKLGGKNA